MPFQSKAATKRARTLRRDSTDAERLLWRGLRNRTFAMHKFRRQHPIGHYFVDFVCVELALIIELDGGQHAERVAADEVRTAFLEARGFRVLRFWNNDVLGNLGGVLITIEAELKSPHPAR
jgi:very-short-patch-repair endonuclease